MAEIINLRLARKRKARSAKEEIADTNRKKHGISTHIRKAEKVVKQNSDKKIDGHFLDKSDSNKE